eukprot:1192160-Prorocentrum_minimum.AAC.1
MNVRLFGAATVGLVEGHLALWFAYAPNGATAVLALPETKRGYREVELLIVLMILDAIYTRRSFSDFPMLSLSLCLACLRLWLADCGRGRPQCLQRSAGSREELPLLHSLKTRPELDDPFS